VFDFDDAIIYRDSFHGRPWLLPDRLVGFRAMVRSADHITAGNSYLADLARRIGGDTAVTVIPTVIDAARYNHLSQTSEASKEFSIGWIGQRTTLPYLENLHGALRLVSETIARSRLVTVSDRHPAMHGIRAEAIMWSSDNEVDALSRFDVGVAPLADNRWTGGKCGLRLLQYLAAGVPAVASPVGTQREIIAGGGCLKATTSTEWVDAIVRLSRDTFLRQNLVETGRRMVRTGYIPEVWTDLLCTAWCNIVKKKP
jgi:glycosyltransferase involved in cell wall biosynthesis